jgi:hypothetical protein
MREPPFLARNRMTASRHGVTLGNTIVTAAAPSDRCLQVRGMQTASLSAAAAAAASDAAVFSAAVGETRFVPATAPI